MELTFPKVGKVEDPKVNHAMYSSYLGAETEWVAYLV